MFRRFGLLAGVLVATTACVFDTSGFTDVDDASVAPRIDANPSAPDADPSAPDANPSAPDANPSAPDASSPPDASPPPDAPSPPDAAIPDAAPPPDAPCPGSVVPFDPSNIPDRCALPAADGGWMIPTGVTWTVDTDTGMVAYSTGGTAATDNIVIDQPGGPELRVIVVDGLNVATGGRLAFTGSRPAALVSYGGMTIDGVVFAGAVGAQPGAGGEVACVAGAGANGAVQTTSADLDGGSGGAGGGFGSNGGDGAKVNDSPGSDPAGATANGNTTLVPLRGGCGGGNGGLSGGPGGGGGGGLQLVAATGITINGRVAAPGGGGQSVTGSSSGGGGGGSGGALLIEAASLSVSITGVVSANGGGGAEGSRGATSTWYGQDGHIDDANPALAGNGSSMGGDGGNGGSELAGAQDGREGISNVSSAAGGGGGGGSVGRIHFYTTGSLSIVGVVSPAAE